MTDFGLSVHGFGRRLVVTHNGHRSRLDQLMSIDLQNLIRKHPDEFSECGLIRERGEKPVLHAEHVLNSFWAIADDSDVLPALVKIAEQISLERTIVLVNFYLDL